MKPISDNPAQGKPNIKELLAYLSKHGQSGGGLGIDQSGDPDLRENRARRVTEMEEAPGEMTYTADPDMALDNAQPQPAGMRVLRQDDNPAEEFSDLKRGIGWVESNNNYAAQNPTTSATGKYQQMHRGLSNEPEMTYEGTNDGHEASNLMSRDSLANNPALQEEFMDRSINEGIGGRSLMRHARELTQEYQGQLGDRWNFREDEVAALSHFLGREGTRQYFASIRDNTPFSIPGTNHTAEMYLEKYNEGINREQ